MDRSNILKIIIKKLAVKTGVKLGGLFKIPTASQSQPVFVEPMDFESKILSFLKTFDRWKFRCGK